MGWWPFKACNSQPVNEPTLADLLTQPGIMSPADLEIARMFMGSVTVANARNMGQDGLYTLLIAAGAGASSQAIAKAITTLVNQATALGTPRSSYKGAAAFKSALSRYAGAVVNNTHGDINLTKTIVSGVRSSSGDITLSHVIVVGDVTTTHGDTRLKDCVVLGSITSSGGNITFAGNDNVVTGNIRTTHGDIRGKRLAMSTNTSVSTSSGNQTCSPQILPWPDLENRIWQIAGNILPDSF